ncbi:MAG: hypothetical protein MK212_00175 [Saprospiraceae bacterium]|nr:hypothetical protein [Saprospiraceae bacterium]
MKTFKIAIFSILTVGLCSFALFNTTSSEELPVDQELYQKFLKTFDKVELPYKITFDKPKTTTESLNREHSLESRKAEKGNDLDYEFSKFIPSIKRGYMSRMGPDEYKSDALLTSNDLYSAVIYKKRPNYSIGFTKYVLATFNSSGKLISERTIAYNNSDYYEEPTIDKNLNIKIAHYKANHGKNKKISYDLEKMEEMSISKYGEIIAAGETPNINSPEELNKAIQLDLWED